MRVDFIMQGFADEISFRGEKGFQSVLLHFAPCPLARRHINDAQNVLMSHPRRIQ